MPEANAVVLGSVSDWYSSAYSQKLCRTDTHADMHPKTLRNHSAPYQTSPTTESMETASPQLDPSTGRSDIYGDMGEKS